MLPPNDPRLLSLTEEQMNLDLQHYKIDHPDKFKETFIDAGFNEYEEEVEADGGSIPASEVPKARQKEEPPPADEWEDISDDELERDGKGGKV